jgi:hypothetical protein
MTSKPGTKEQCFEQLLLGKTVKSESWLAPELPDGKAG